ncbi:hypothetical protein [Caulobacter sp. 17J80-11]|uniref:hypothetical protein n=1 Tax=Caulobacter sp. 17J80-11 TaxID=2763502 RepID=UPI0016538878|nr:hypothetical protein [Caulobacter sp. 17J80-11]MBC6982904.1 hypothetical protein [Caulobacter sp. 17J80-11]
MSRFVAVAAVCFAAVLAGCQQSSTRFDLECDLTRVATGDGQGDPAATLLRYTINLDDGWWCIHGSCEAGVRDRMVRHTDTELVLVEGERKLLTINRVTGRYFEDIRSFDPSLPVTGLTTFGKCRPAPYTAPAKPKF